MRAYTVQEIDRMRDLIVEREVSRQTRPYTMAAVNTRAEELLRTYILGGCDPQELEAELTRKPA